MKALLIIISAAGLLSFSSCSQTTTPKTFLENPENRKEVFNTIKQNEAYRSEFMKTMHGDNASMQMMVNDSTMMNAMMKDEKAMGSMMKMMHEKGMMSEDCMKSCTTMMEGKGMDMKGMKKMSTGDSPVMDDHKNHH